MRCIAHLSDIHFGAIDYTIVAPLIETVNALDPDVVAVSGDLTQRARSHQFVEARAFLDKLPHPQIIVPGNHDVPLYNIFRRFASPLVKYRRYITDDLQPFFADEEIAVAGINTARSLTIKGGRINATQIDWVRRKLCEIPDNVVKFVVTHHPFDLPVGHHESDIVGRAPLAVKGLAECGADAFLAGHMHISHTGHTAVRYKIPGHSALIIQAGTAASTRGRGEANSFNLIRIDGLKILIERFHWQPRASKFTSASSESFHREASAWIPD
jgi:Predicted phosphohydrolases